jgi:hypothetical protein
LLEGWQNRYSYDTVGTTTGFRSAIMGLKVSMIRFQKWRISFICTIWVNADDLMKPHGSIRVVRKWRSKHTNPILRCFVNLEGLNYGDLLVGIVSEFPS